MNMDFHKIGQAANLAVVKACRLLNKRGFPGEAARAWEMADSWRDLASLLLVNNSETVSKAPARKVVYGLSLCIYNDILKAELNTRGAKA